MCPAHRRKVIAELKEKLQIKTEKCICISTRLIEAGVDIDFDAAIRFLAGFDSIAQTAGRCNRNGNLRDELGNLITGKTYIINIKRDDEHIGQLKELVLGQNIMGDRILDEFHTDELRYGNTLLHPDLITRYFDYFYAQMSDEKMKYKTDVGRQENIFELLSDNAISVGEYNTIEHRANSENARELTQFHQSFETAWKKFEVIEESTIGVIVPFEEGEDIIKELYGTSDIKKCEILLREAQGYSVNVYYNRLGELQEKGIARQITGKNKLKIYAVEKEHYDRYIGLTQEANEMTLLQL
jgi:CRISPR-associated endonuclease/helicase Cas3